MKLRFQYLPYRRKFLRPLATAHGPWKIREGIVIRVERSDGRVGFGEIAPLPEFGTETFEQAFSWCREHEEKSFQSYTIPDNLPCCQWAVASALAAIEESTQMRTFPVAALVDSPLTLAKKQEAGYQVFKLKIGVRELSEEVKRIEACFDQLDSGQVIRLDANGGLTETDLKAWLELLEGRAVEYLEQPLPPGFEYRMEEIAEPFSTPLALDESIAGMASLEKWKDWPGPLVIKPSLLGYPSGDVPSRIIGSSVFETSFGLEAALQFLARFQKADTAIGFDTISPLEEDGWNIHAPRPSMTSGSIDGETLQQLWESLK